MSKPSKKNSHRAKPISAAELEKKFETGEDISEHFDSSQDRVFSGGAEEEIPPPNTSPKMVNVEFPAWMVAGLDLEADRLGIARQALIKVWVAERLEQQKARRAVALT